MFYRLANEGFVTTTTGNLSVLHQKKIETERFVPTDDVAKTKVSKTVLDEVSEGVRYLRYGRGGRRSERGERGYVQFLTLGMFYIYTDTMN